MAPYTMRSSMNFTEMWLSLLQTEGGATTEDKLTRCCVLGICIAYYFFVGNNNKCLFLQKMLQSNVFLKG